VTKWADDFKRASRAYRARQRFDRAAADFGADFGSNYNANSGVLKQVQAKLNSLGMASPSLAVDGRIGPLTVAAIKKFQTSKGLTPDGVVGDQTLTALGIPSPSEVPTNPATPTSIGPATPTNPDPSQFASLVAFAAKYGQKIVQASGYAPGLQATRAAVVQSFVPWSTPFEGYLNGPYTDAKGLITTGMGNLIDSQPPSPTPTAKARSLPWSPNNIDADWAILRANWPRVQSRASMNLTTSRLSPQAVTDLIVQTMREEEPAILRLFPGFRDFPADAQLAIWSMVWAEGTGNLAKFRALIQAANSGDFVTAAAQSHMQGVGIDIRNLANKLLFLNAAAVRTLSADPTVLYYLDGLTRLAGTAESLARLQRDIVSDPRKAAGYFVWVIGVVLTFVGLGFLIEKKWK
jgi:peptidoglycan hydrolase-like protein with peptidoglycan-binding domain